MKFRLPILFATILAFPAVIQSQGLPPAPMRLPVFEAPESNEKPSVVDADVSTHVPMVEVMVNGQGPFRFLVDTGAQGYARLSPATAEKLNLAITDTVQVGDPSGVNARTVSLHKIDEIRLGDTTFRNISATSSIPPAVAARRGFDGILGIDLFKNYVLTLDYAAGKLILDTDPIKPGAGVHSFTREDGFMNVQAMIGDTSVRLHLDSGNSVGALTVPETLATSLAPNGTPREVTRAQTVSNTFIIKALSLTAPVTLAGVALSVPDVTYPSPGPVGGIGGKALQGLVLKIDQKQSLLSLARPTPGK